MNKIARWLSLMLTLVCVSAVQVNAEDDFGLYSLEGYRLLRYRSPTPATHDDAQTVTTAQLQRLMQTTPALVLLDVQPLIWRAGHFIQTEPRQQIAGSVWLPNVGQGELESAWAGYYREQLALITRGQQDTPIVIYCTADCWMSWNAVKRAAEWGYTQLYWYREGSDGWRDAGLATVAGQPVPLTLPMYNNLTTQER